MWVSIELEIWYRDLAVTTQCTGLSAPGQESGPCSMLDRASRKCQAVVLEHLQNLKPDSRRFLGHPTWDIPFFILSSQVAELPAPDPAPNWAKEG